MQTLGCFSFPIFNGTDYNTNKVQHPLSTLEAPLVKPCGASQETVTAVDLNRLCNDQLNDAKKAESTTFRNNLLITRSTVLYSRPQKNLNSPSCRTTQLILLETYHRPDIASCFCVCLSVS